ncbi:ion channel [Paenibacillus whitsoniae]|nr:ion channel [Paenibacillus whitsoniae]
MVKRTRTFLGCICLIFIFSILTIGVPSSNSYAADSSYSVLTKAKVAQVLDLETLKLEDGDTIKLYGINVDYYKEYIQKYKQEEKSVMTEDGIHVITDDMKDIPEYRVHFVSSAYFKGESLEYLISRAKEYYNNLLLNHDIFLKRIGSNDEYLVFLDENLTIDFNQLIVQEGFVVVSKENNELPSLWISQEKAKTSKAGLWGITVYRSYNTPDGNSNYSSIAFSFIVLSMIYCLFCYFYYYYKKNFLSLVAVYASFLSLSPTLSSIYPFNQNHNFYWVPPTVTIILIILCIINFIRILFSNRHNHIGFVSTHIVLYATLVIVSFAVLYCGISNSSIKTSEISYSLPDFKLQSTTTEMSAPSKNYLNIPLDDYDTYDMSLKNGNTLHKVNYKLKFSDAIYYSATTFFTVGYGDLSPKGDLRYIAIAEMVLGFISQVILFSLVVTKINFARSNPMPNHDHLVDCDNLPPRVRKRNDWRIMSIIISLLQLYSIYALISTFINYVKQGF